MPPVPVPWFLDVDGVLNLGHARSDRWPDYASGHVQSRTPRTVTFFTWPPLLVQVINVMAARGLVRIRWLTSWEFEAPGLVAPMMGLQVGSWVAGENREDEGFAWKLRVVQEHMADDDGFFIWTDDDIDRDRPARQMTDFLPDVRALVMCPDAQHGLTPADMHRILSAIETCCA